MFEHLTEDELDRMTAFRETPSYKREPEQLLPDGEDAEGSATPDEPGRD